MALSAALTIASIATQLGGAALSFGQAAKQARMMREADARANKYIESAKSNISKIRSEEVQLPLKQRELTEKARAVGMKQALEAFQETGPRAVIGGVPKAQQIDVAARAQEQAQTEQQLFQREQAIAKEKERRDLALAEVDLMGAQGAAQAAADAQKQRAAAITGGVTALSGALQTGADLVDLYPQQKLSKQVDALTKRAGSGEGVADLLTQAQATGAITAEQFAKFDLPAIRSASGYNLNQTLEDQFNLIGIDPRLIDLNPSLSGEQSQFLQEITPALGGTIGTTRN